MAMGIDDESGGLSPSAIIKHSGTQRHSPGLSTEGLLSHATSGRTDRLPMDVPTGSYVLPADVVSGLGEGNTLAGAKVVDMILNSGPHGMEVKAPRGGISLPHPPHVYSGQSEFASGGEIDKPVKVIVAGGEYLISPKKVAMLGGYGSPDGPSYDEAMKHGHDILDHFVLHIRDHTVKTTAKLPPPKK